MAKSKNLSKTQVIRVNEPPRIATLNFGKKPGVFSGGRSVGPRTNVILPPIRITQNKGGGGK